MKSAVASLSTEFRTLSGTVTNLSGNVTALLQALAASTTTRSDAILGTVNTQCEQIKGQTHSILAALTTQHDRLYTRIDSVHDLASVTSTIVEELSKLVRDALVRGLADSAADPVPGPSATTSDHVLPVPASDIPTSNPDGDGSVPASIPGGDGGVPASIPGGDGGVPASAPGGDEGVTEFPSIRGGGAQTGSSRLPVSGSTLPAGSASVLGSLGVISSSAGQTLFDEVTDLVSGGDRDTIVDPSASNDRIFELEPDVTVGESDIEMEDEFLRPWSVTLEAGVGRVFGEYESEEYEEYEEDEIESEEE
jgi:hypothetical protein